MLKAQIPFKICRGIPPSSVRRSPITRSPWKWIAKASSPDDAEPTVFNPFHKKKKNSEEAAKKALEEMFSGKKDVLSAFDQEIGDGGSGGGDDAGGGGGGWNWDDWKNNFGNFRKALVGWILSVGKTLGAVALFILFMGGMSMLGPMSSKLLLFLKVLLRLEKSSDVYASPSSPAGSKRSALFDDDDENEPDEPTY